MTRHWILIASLVVFPGCSRDEPQPERTPSPETARAEVASPFFAVGQEPGWTLRIAHDTLDYSGDYGGAPFRARGAHVTSTTSGRRTDRWTARAESAQVLVIARDTACQDAMSGAAYGTHVTVRVGDAVRTGCGDFGITGPRQP